YEPLEDRGGLVPVGAGGRDLDAVLELVVHLAGVDGVDPDTARCHLLGQRPHQPDQRVLGRGVSADPRRPGQPDHAGGDDHARARLQVRHRVLADQEGAAHMHGEDLVEYLFWVVGGLAVAATLIAPRGLWGFAADRFGWSLLPV